MWAIKSDTAAKHPVYGGITRAGTHDSVYIIKIHIYIVHWHNRPETDLFSNGFLDKATGPKAIFTYDYL